MAFEPFSGPQQEFLSRKELKSRRDALTPEEHADSYETQAANALSGRDGDKIRYEITQYRSRISSDDPKESEKGLDDLVRALRERKIGMFTTIDDVNESRSAAIALIRKMAH